MREDPKKPHRQKRRHGNPENQVRTLRQLKDAITPLLPTDLQAGDISIDLSSVITEKEARESTLLLTLIIRDHFTPLLAEQGLAVTKSIGLEVRSDRVLRGRLKAINKP